MLSHLRNYASAGVVTALAGLISFPILTRNLSVSDYGIVGLLTASLTLFIAVGKLGMQHAVVRFYAQVKHNNIAFNLNQLNSTVSVVFFCLASMATLLWLASGIFIIPNVMQYEGLPSLFVLASAIVFLRLMGSGAINFLRSQRRSGDVAIIESSTRCLNLTFTISLLLMSALNPWTVIGCMLVAEVFGVCYAFYSYSADFHFSFDGISGALAKSMLFYGMPLMILESLEMLLVISDRYMIESIIGASALGQYSASYNLTSYLDIIVLVALVESLKPAYLHTWEEQGKEATQKFLSKFLRIFLIAGIPFFTMFALTAPHLLSFLAGPKYSPGTVIMPFITMSYFLQGCMHVLTAGLYIFKDTKGLVFWSCVATVTNIGLNLLVIPKYGIAGAAMVSLFAYSVFTAGVSARAFGFVSYPISLRIPLLIAATSVITFSLLNQLTYGSHVVDFLAKGAIGTTIFLLTMWLVEPEIRFWIAARFKSLRATEAIV